MPPRYTEEFRKDAANQVLINNYPIKEVASRLGIHYDSLKAWVKKYKDPQPQEQTRASDISNAEIKRLQKELKRVTEERDILKKAAAYFASNLS
jgi:transposase